jgi:hypothetical protein
VLPAWLTRDSKVTLQQQIERHIYTLGVVYYSKRSLRQEMLLFGAEWLGTIETHTFKAKGFKIYNLLLIGKKSNLLTQKA